MATDKRADQPPDHGFFAHSDKGLVDHIVGSLTAHDAGHNAALAEMQRRQIEATRALNRSATFQAWVMIALTVAILLLTAVLAWQGLKS